MRSLVILIFTLSLPVCLYTYGQGILSVFDKFGTTTGVIVAALNLPVLFGIALLVDKREGREYLSRRQRPR